MPRVAFLLAGIFLLAGCGGETDEPRAAVQQSAAERARPVIKAWSDALRGSDVERAIGYFAVPAIVAQGTAVKLTTRAQVRIFNAGLPCGARLQGVEQSGRYVVGSFKLTERPGMTCDGPGNLARVAFVIRKGKIAEWRQLTAPQPSDPNLPET